MWKKVLIVLAIVVALGVAGFLYFTRPLEAPSVDVREATESLQETQESGEVLYRISQEDSTVEYNIDETLRGDDITVVGATSEVAGDIIVNTADPSLSRVGTMKINARTFQTDEPRRDAAVGRGILESENDEYEFITFEPSSIEGLPAAWTYGEAVEVSVTGDLTIKDTTQTVTFEGTATLTEDQLTTEIQTTVNYEDFDVFVPELPFLANVSKEAVLKATLVADAAQVVSAGE